MIHVVFNASEIELMKEVINLDKNLAGEIVQIKDDYAVGPLANLDTEDGWQERLAWWKELLKGSPYENDPVTRFDDREIVRVIKSKLQNSADEQVWIWAGQNQHDVCGYFWLISKFKEFQGRIMIIYLNNLPFINEKGQLFYPSWLQEIQSKELLKAKRLARAVTLSEFEVDPDEWKKICDENAWVRSLEGGKKIIGNEETFYDGEILKNITSEWQKATRVLSNTLHRMKIKTGDVFIMWRMKKLVAQEKIEAMGNIDENWKSFDVRKPGMPSLRFPEE
ncbi:MAG: DUF1835 domain-containing protein [Bacteroidetes bacterium]|nr:DUF1835 domain-containing protein [Bacteroidota bacterium]MBS1931822.1 DUF1835 domain-containing protein [Bacteroidota bacterium]